MKISPEDPITTAYALGELDDSSRALVEEAYAKDEKLAAEGAAISSLASLMTETLQGESHSLGEARRDEIFKAGRRPDANVLVLDHKRRSRRQSIMAVIGVAAVVVIGFVGLSRFQTSGSNHGASGEVANGSGGSDQSSLPGNEGEDQSGSTPSDEGSDMGSVILQLDREPIDLSFVERSLSENGALPAREQFSVGGWANAGAVVSPPVLKLANLGVYIELGPCSWDDQKSLLLVSLRSLDGKDVSVKATLNFNPDSVLSSHLLGSRESSPTELSQASVMKQDQTFLYLVELLPNLESVGAIDLLVQNDLNGYLPLVDLLREEDEVTDGFRQARVLVEYAQWGASEARDLETLRRLAMEAKDLLGRVSDERARYALDMILLSEESLMK